VNWQKLFDTRRRVQLAVHRDDGKRQLVRRYPSVVEHRGPNELWLRTPPGGPFDGGVVMLGEPAEVELGDETGLFSFPVTVRRRANCFHVDCLVLQLDGEPTHRQRRGHVRVEVHKPVVVRSGREVWSGWMHNLSAGGMLVHLDGRSDAIPLGAVVGFELHAAANEPPAEAHAPIHGEARVVRSEGPGVYAVDFQRLSEAHRQWIVRYVFRRQIELKRRGLDDRVTR
jgi:c-di-GMP-binding flagellar brake protein YcgR